MRRVFCRWFGHRWTPSATGMRCTRCGETYNSHPVYGRVPDIDMPSAEGEGW